jgi:hypothetical protein
MRVARRYCRHAQKTFSLLPDCLAARLPGSLDEVERVVKTVETSAGVEAAALVLRPEVHLPSAVRWVRRRQMAVAMTLVALVTLMPERLGRRAQLGAIGELLSTERVLVALRGIGARHLAELARPLGFRPYRRARGERGGGVQHKTGPDPPPSAPY